MLLRRHRLPHRVDVCPVCGSDFVHPLTWAEEDDNHWWILLRCGGCDGRYEAVVLDETADRFDAKLDRDQFLIAKEADRIHDEWRRAEVDALVSALQRDLITADDFAV